jgi:hypothetical protein
MIFRGKMDDTNLIQHADNVKLLQMEKNNKH